MQLSYTVSSLTLFILAMASAGTSTPLTAPSENDAATNVVDEPAPYIVSHEQMMHWIANTDAELTFIGKPINPLTPRSAQDTTVTYCTNRVFSICGGPCTVYTGGPTCLNAPNTNCLSATANVAFCSGKGCTNPCNPLATCGVKLDNGFCFTPNTQSIVVPA